MRKCKRRCYIGREINKIWLPVILFPLQLLLFLPHAQKIYFSTIPSFFPSVASRNISVSFPDHPYPHFSTAIIPHLPTKNKQANKKHTTTPPQKKSTYTMLSTLSHLLPTWLENKGWFCRDASSVLLVWFRYMGCLVDHQASPWISLRHILMLLLWM